MIVWLASYPKSGNTWLRLFLAQYLRNEQASINDIRFGAIASSRDAFDASVGFDASLLAHDEIDGLRREVYFDRASKANETLYCKVHDAYALLPDGRPLFPPEVTAGVIYLVRNPWDLAVSFAHHAGELDIDRVIGWMNDPAYALSGELDRQSPQLRQRLGTWSQHVVSWLDSGLRVLVVKYEDLSVSPVDQFRRVVDFLGLPAVPDGVEIAAERCRFERLQAEELAQGFAERPARSARFFREGRVGGWRDALSDEQVERIQRQHAPTLARFGYDVTMLGRYRRG